MIIGKRVAEDADPYRQHRRGDSRIARTYRKICSDNGITPKPLFECFLLVLFFLMKEKYAAPSHPPHPCVLADHFFTEEGKEFFFLTGDFDLGETQEVGGLLLGTVSVIAEDDDLSVEG